MEDTSVLISVVGWLVVLLVVGVMAVTGKQSIATLADKISEAREDRRFVDALEKAFAQSSQEKQALLRMATDMASALGRANLPVIDSVVDEAAKLLDEITDGKPSEKPNEKPGNGSDEAVG